MKRKLLIIALAIATLGLVVSSASAGVQIPGPSGTPDHFCWSLGDETTIMCITYGVPPAEYKCTYSGGSYKCEPLENGTQAGARRLEEDLGRAGTGPNNPGLSGPAPPAQGTARGAGAPSIAGYGNASDNCHAKGTVSVPRTASVRTLHLDFGDGSSINYSVPSGTGTYTVSFDHAYPGGLTFDPNMSGFSSTVDYEAVAAMTDTGAWDATAFRHYTENITP